MVQPRPPIRLSKFLNLTTPQNRHRQVTPSIWLKSCVAFAKKLPIHGGNA
jgi:hypothetical protein